MVIKMRVERERELTKKDNFFIVEGKFNGSPDTGWDIGWIEEEFIEAEFSKEISDFNITKVIPFKNESEYLEYIEFL